MKEGTQGSFNFEDKTSNLKPGRRRKQRRAIVNFRQRRGFDKETNKLMDQTDKPLTPAQEKRLNKLVLSVRDEISAGWTYEERMARAKASQSSMSVEDYITRYGSIEE